MIEKYKQIRQVEQTNFVLKDIYHGYLEFWDIMDEIESDPEKITLYEKEIDILYQALKEYIAFRSNYKQTLKGLIQNEINTISE